MKLEEFKRYLTIKLHTAFYYLTSPFKNRTYFLITFLCSILLILCIRVFALQYYQNKRYKAIRDKNAFQILELPSPRGNIFDRNGELLAISRKVKSFYAVPIEIEDKRKFARDVSRVLEISEDWIYEKIASPQNCNKKFIWIKRKLSEEEVQKIENSKLEGCGFRYEYERFYPRVKSLRNLLGFVNEDEIGIDGVELSFDHILKGRNSYRAVFLDATRKAIITSENDYSTNRGGDVYLTIDLGIQEIVEEEIKILEERWKPKAINIVVMDPFTFELLSIAGQVYNVDEESNLFRERISRNIFITDPFEMGSLFKPFVMACALDLNVVTPDTKIYCEEGSWRVRSRTLHDYKSFGELTATEVISYSSNIGISKVAFKIGKQRLKEYLMRMGFGNVSGIEFIYEHPGSLISFRDRDHYCLTSVPIGHGISATSLQLARAFCALINGGILKKPTILSEFFIDNKFYHSQNSGEIRIIKPETSRKIKDMLAEVVEGGTGKNAKLDDYKSGGKTGTAKKIDSFGRYTNRYISSYIGFAPFEKPRLVVIVVVDEPKGEYYASKVAAPAVKNILNRTLKYLDILPER